MLTIRNARRGTSVSLKAQISENSGADSIVVHLEDRRHIKEEDINLLLKNIKIPLQRNSTYEFMFNFAIKNNIKKFVLFLKKEKN